MTSTRPHAGAETWTFAGGVLDAEPTDKAELGDQLGITLRYDPARTVTVRRSPVGHRWWCRRGDPPIIPITLGRDSTVGVGGMSGLPSTTPPAEIERIRRRVPIASGFEDRLYPPFMLRHDPAAFAPGSAGSQSRCAFCSRFQPWDPRPVDCDGVDRAGRRVAVCRYHWINSPVWNRMEVHWFPDGLDAEVVREVRTALVVARTSGRLTWDRGDPRVWTAEGLADHQARLVGLSTL